MLFWFLIGAAGVFFVYAMVTQYSKTDAALPVQVRVWAAVAAAGASIGAAASQWFAQ